MKFKDYYRVLGLPPGASAAAIKDAYHKLAKQFHPDVSKTPGTEQRFTEIGEANEVLKDPAKRSAYDRLRAGGWRDGQEMNQAADQAFHQHSNSPNSGSSSNRGGNPQGWSSGGFQADPRFSDFFESLFNRQESAGARQRERSYSSFTERGDDIHVAFSVSLEESFLGGERQFRLQTPTLSSNGDFVEGSRTMSVKIPKGTIKGDRLRLRGQGQPGIDAAANGDLILDIDLATHDRYRVDGRDLLLEVPITPWEAVLGAQIAVPTLGGTVTATIPPGSQGGDKLRLKGRGLPGEPPGDQYLLMKIALPPTASDPAKQLYRDLAKESTFDPRASLKN
ncbi:curved DNA-binding protein [Planctomycetota bacterium]|nr:curved DNA-binding protein [Planctomycetota bacterium]